MLLPPDCEDFKYPTEVVPHYGQAAKERKRWPRWEFECHAARLLLEGNSVGLFGLRRIGKSSSMEGVTELLRKASVIPITIELQGSNCIEDLVSELVNACERQREPTIANNIRGIFTDTMIRLPATVINTLRIRTGGAANAQAKQATPRDVFDFLQTILGSIAERLRKSEQKIVLILDELPFFCQNLHQHSDAKAGDITAFLAELRRWRSAGLPMLIGGSIGVHRLERDLGIDPNLLGDLNYDQLHTLEKEEAAAMTDALAKGCQFSFWTPDYTTVILDTVPAAYPAFFHKIFLELRKEARLQKLSVEKTKTIAVATTEEVLQKNFFPQFDHRLRYYEKGDADVAKTLFRTLSKNNEDIEAKVLGKAFPKDWTLEQRSRILSALIQDDFLKKPSKNQYSFATPLVSMWWSEQNSLI